MVPAVLVVPVVVVGCSGNSSLVQAQPTKIPCQVEQGRQLNVWKRGRWEVQGSLQWGR